MNKKGQMSTMTVIIIILAAGLVMVMVATSFGAGLKKSTRGEDCQKQILLKTMTTYEKGYGLLKYEGVSASCPIYEVTIGSEKTVIYKNQKKFLTMRYDALTEEQLYHILAEELRYCWNQYGAGTIDAFWYPEDFFSNIISGGQDYKGCRPCSTITFDDTVPGSKYLGLRDYLKTTEFLTKNKVESGSSEEMQTYYSYLAEKERYCADEYQGGENCWDEYAVKTGLPRLAEPIIDTSKTYHTVLVRKGLEKEEGTLNPYLMDEYQFKDYKYCQVILPYSG